MRALRGFVLVMVAMLVAGGRAWAQGQGQRECTAWVWPGESIQAAIDRAEAGAVICLAAGTWEENVEIKKTLTLRGVGADRTIIHGVRAGYPVIWITTPEEAQAVSVQLAGLMITGGSGECVDTGKGICPDGLLVEGPVQVEVTDCSISATAHHGICVVLAEVVITGSTISGCSNDGLVLVSAQATVSALDICENHLYGVRLWGAAQLEISDSAIHGNRRDGIRLASSSAATILGTRITANGRYGVALYRRPCYETDWDFTGYVSGGQNTIPGPGEPEGNGKGAVCPAPDLDFLTAEGGGCYGEACQ